MTPASPRQVNEPLTAAVVLPLPGPGSVGRACRPWRSVAAAALVFAAALAVYLSNGRTISSGDTVPAALMPIALLLDGTVTFDRFAAEEDRRWSGNAYFFRPSPHGVVSFYPVATGLLATPVYALPVLARLQSGDPTPGEWIDFAERYEKLAAAIITALSVAAFWAACRALGFASGLSLGLTALYGFGSEAFGTSALGLWQHGPACLAVIAAIGGFVALDQGRRGGAWLLSLCAGLAVAIRMNDALLVAPLVALALWRHPRRWPALILPGAAVAAALCAYNQVVFGLPLGPYQGAGSALGLARIPLGLAGSLVSPGRGLFIYFPAALMAAWLLLRHPALLGQRLVLGLVVGIVATALLNASYVAWWGGFSYGPRYFAECQPAILFVLGFGLMHLAPAARRRAVALCFGVLLPYSVFVQALFVYGHEGHGWNATPRSVDEAPERLWDVVDNPILRGVRGHPPAGG